MSLDDQIMQQNSKLAVTAYLVLGGACQPQLACNLLAIFFFVTLDRERRVRACLEAEVRLAISCYSKLARRGRQR